jgi:arylsulfatase
MAGNAPFKRWKRETHEGGVADPCIVSWPSRLPERGEIRSQFVHAVDIYPTVLELAGIDPPAAIGHVPQSALDGISFAPVLAAAGASEPAPRQTQYFEMFGSRALYHDGWKAVTFKPIAPLYDDGISANTPFSDDRWELYHVAVDRAEIHDLAEQEPERLAELVELWWREARRNLVLPLDNRILHAINNPKPDWRRPRLVNVLYPGTSPVPESVAPNVKNRGHQIDVDVTVPDGPEGSAEGVLLAQGSVLGGFSFHLFNGRPRYVHNLYGKELHVITAAEPVSAGRHLLTYRFDRHKNAGGDATLLVDGSVVASGHIPLFTVAAFNETNAGLTCGYELGPAVGDDYEAPFRSTVDIRTATITLSEHAPINPMVEFERIMAEQ